MYQSSAIKNYFELMNLVHTRSPVENFQEKISYFYNLLAPSLNGQSRDYRRAMKIAGILNLVASGWKISEASLGSCHTVVFADGIMGKFMACLEDRVDEKHA